ncbi:hypothetical protein V8J88_13640 [Massilia sp. W12]|uniref:hypothetical protein n=1 Tax=Massilia sp. W12 TaxID=3126507 RepID=UPI0030D32218
MPIIDTFRTLAGIRKERRLPPPGERPQTGSNIALGNLRMQLKLPITPEQWRWLVSMGWRKVDLRTDRRQYQKVDEQLALRLLMLDDEAEREQLHARIIQLQAKSPAPRRNAS